MYTCTHEYATYCAHLALLVYFFIVAWKPKKNIMDWVTILQFSLQWDYVIFFFKIEHYWYWGLEFCLPGYQTHFKIVNLQIPPPPF